MGIRNQTITTEFILLGFSNDLKTNASLFVVFLLMYLFTFVANGLIICTVIYNKRLHTPMYFFLCNVAFLDLGYSTNSVPQFLVNLLQTQRMISLAACSFQIYSGLFLGTSQCILLAAMAYDRYVAICHPLHYPVLMRLSFCCYIMVFIWTLSFFIAVVPSLTMPVALCYPNKINHFMCEVLAVLKLACDDIVKSELLIFSISFISLLVPFMCIIASYICIIYSVLQIQSVEKRKAFSTCISHITVVILCYGSLMVLYFGSSTSYASDQEKYISVVYVVITPMLNPLIYSLNNREITETIKKMLVLLHR